jgi:hypothetical protein
VELYLCESKDKIIQFDELGTYHDQINNKHKMLVKLIRDESVRRIEKKINLEMKDERHRSQMLLEENRAKEKVT